MLKFIGEGKRGRVFFLGLSRENVNNLISGHPIKIDLASMGGPSVEIAILFGETEKLLFNELKKAGLLGPDTEYRDVDPHMVEVVRVIDESSSVPDKGTGTQVCQM